VTIRLLTGDCRDVLATLPEASVHMCVTSPPYYALRSYLHAEHPDKHRELGSEATPEAYLAALVEVFRAVRRVLRDDGTCWVNQGDLFINKQLQLMPARFALALQADGWFIRSSIIWHKPNPMPESCTDRCTSAHEHVFMLTKRARYYFDSAAIAEPASYAGEQLGLCRGTKRRAYAVGLEPTGNERPGADADIAATRACRNVWTIPTAPFADAHFATFPPALVERCIRAGTSERGCCAACGAPWVREVERGAGYPEMPSRSGTKADPISALSHAGPAVRRMSGKEQVAWRDAYPHVTLGWRASCQCQAGVVPCTVLDCFSGAGTSLLVSDRLGRDAIGIDLSHQYVEMTRERITDDCPLFTSWAPAETDAQDERMRDLFSVAAD
jgi:DNA modification methylase